MNSYKFVAYIAASASLLLCGQASAWVPYNEFLTQDQYENLQSPPVEESLYVAGLRLTVDRTQLGWSLPLSWEKGLQGSMDGPEYSVKIFRVPSNNLSLAEIAAQMKSDGIVLLITRAIKARHNLKGLRALYGEKNRPSGATAREIRYFFVNPSGETICFAATAKSSHPDWSYFNYLMSHEIEPARS